MRIAVARSPRRREQQVTLTAEAMLALDNYGIKPIRHDAKLTCQRTIDVPEPTIDDMKACG
jgi:hypothetical protein